MDVLLFSRLQRREHRERLPTWRQIAFWCVCRTSPSPKWQICSILDVTACLEAGLFFGLHHHDSSFAGYTGA